MRPGPMSKRRPASTGEPACNHRGAVLLEGRLTALLETNSGHASKSPSECSSRVWTLGLAAHEITIEWVTLKDSGVVLTVASLST